MQLSWRRALSRTVGWLADRRIPGPLRPLVYRGYCAVTGADGGEAQLPLKGYASLGAFFVRRLRAGARAIDAAPDHLVSPCDGTLQAVDRVHEGALLQAKGRPYALEELLGGAARGVELEGAQAWTIYLSPRDYHRVHSPEGGRLVDVEWIPGGRLSVAPSVLVARPRVFATNERAVLRIETAHGPLFLVMVGALNVGRIRIVGVPPGERPERPLELQRGDELARFEMGSTVVLVLPPGTSAPNPTLGPGDALRLGQAIGRFVR